MKKLLLLFAISIVLFSCGSDDDNIEYPNLPPTEEELAKQVSDSLINNYKSQLSYPESLRAVSIVGEFEDAIYLAGKKNERLWLGVFKGAEKVMEDSFEVENIDLEKHNISGGLPLFRLFDQTFCVIYLLTENKNYARTIAKYNFRDLNIKTYNSKFDDINTRKDVKFVGHGFEYSFLFMAQSQMFQEGTNDLIYLDENYENAEVWTGSGDCYDNFLIDDYISKDIYYDYYGLKIRGGNLKSCNSWDLNLVSDIYQRDISSCIFCKIRLEMISENPNSVLFRSYYESIGENREFKINPSTGEIISNRVIN